MRLFLYNPLVLLAAFSLMFLLTYFCLKDKPCPETLDRTFPKELTKMPHREEKVEKHEKKETHTKEKLSKKKSMKRQIPFYQIVDGFRIPGAFSADAFRSAMTYKARPGDLFIVSYPKSGTTWVQNIVGCIYKNGKPFASFLEFLMQAPFLEFTGADAAETMQRPGAIKIHLPFQHAPWSPEAKYLFIARNPKDCCVSFYHHTENLVGYMFVGGSFDDYFELFIKGQTDFGDYFDTVMSWYEHRNDPNVLFITYEELVKDTETNVLKIAEFMGPTYKETLEKDNKILGDVIRHSSFAFMKEDLQRQLDEFKDIPIEMVQHIPDLPSGIKEFLDKADDVMFNMQPSDVTFLRKGIVGDWRNYFTQEQNERMNKKIKERMGGTELEEKWKDVMDINQN